MYTLDISMEFTSGWKISYLAVTNIRTELCRQCSGNGDPPPSLGAKNRSGTKAPMVYCCFTTTTFQLLLDPSGEKKLRCAIHTYLPHVSFYSLCKDRLLHDFSPHGFKKRMLLTPITKPICPSRLSVYPINNSDYWARKPPSSRAWCTRTS